MSYTKSMYVFIWTLWNVLYIGCWHFSDMFFFSDVKWYNRWTVKRKRQHTWRTSFVSMHELHYWLVQNKRLHHVVWVQWPIKLGTLVWSHFLKVWKNKTHPSILGNVQDIDIRYVWSNLTRFFLQVRPYKKNVLD